MAGDRLAAVGHVASAQLASRLFTFLLNVLIARVSPVADYGVGFVSFQLFANLVLFFPKECFRKVALRSDAAEPLQLRSSLNVAWAGLGVAIVACMAVGVYWAFDTQRFGAVGVLGLSALLEAAAEPLVVECLLRSDFRARAIGEGFAIIGKTLATFLWLVLFGNLPLAFAVGCLVYSIVWLTWFGRLCWLSGADPWPAWLPDGTAFAPDHRQLLWSFAGTATLKLLLQEGQQVLLLLFFTQQDWGAFGLVSNLGSIVLRLLFAPTEEIAYAAFGKSVGHPREHWPLLRALLLLQGVVGWLGLCYGPGYSALVVRVLYGTSWSSSDAPQVLSIYCGLLFAMALNGILEAFLFAAAPPLWLRRSQAAAAGASGALVAVAWLLRGQGSAALVWANCTAMVLRVLLCVAFVTCHVGIAWLDLQPPVTLFALVAAGGMLCSIVVPDVAAADALPWGRVGLAVSVAVGAIAATGVLCRRDIIGLANSARGARDKAS